MMLFISPIYWSLWARLCYSEKLQSQCLSTVKMSDTMPGMEIPDRKSGCSAIRSSETCCLEPASCYSFKTAQYHPAADRRWKWGMWESMTIVRIGPSIAHITPICVKWTKSNIKTGKYGPPVSSGRDNLCPCHWDCVQAMFSALPTIVVAFKNCLCASCCFQLCSPVLLNSHW